MQNARSQVKTAPKMRRKIRREEVPCGFNFVVYYAALISLRKSSCCEKFTKITLNFLLSAFLIALLHFSVCVPVLPSAFSFCGRYLLLYPYYLPPFPNLSLTFCPLVLKLIISTGLSSSSGKIPTTTTLVGSKFSHIS